MEDIQFRMALRRFFLKIDHFLSRKGFALIEILVVLSIMMIMLSIGTGIIKSYKNICCSVDVQSCNNSIVSFIMDSKHYCRNNGVPGVIIFDTLNNTISLSVYLNTIRKYKLPDKFKLEETTSADKVITLNSKGLTGDACTIKYLDRKGNEHMITMRVGTFYVEIKN